MTWKVNEKARKNIENETGRTFLCYNEETAKELTEYLNQREQETRRIIKIPAEEELNLFDDFKEWNILIGNLNKNTRRLVELEEIIPRETDRIIAEAIENKVDFKALYGSNTKEVRQRYAEDEIADLIAEKQELKLANNEDSRRISFLKKLIEMKTKLIGV